MKTPERIYEDYFGHKPSKSKYEHGSFTWFDIKAIMIEYAKQFKPSNHANERNYRDKR